MSCCTVNKCTCIHGTVPSDVITNDGHLFFAIKNKTSVAYRILCNKLSRDIKQRKCVLNKVNLNNMYVQLI